MTITPDALEREFSLTTAVTRLDFLSRRDSGATTLEPASPPDEPDSWADLKGSDISLDVAESLELLALGEVVARKAHDSQLVGFRAALRNGASWPDIAAALAVTPGEAWDAYRQLVDRQEGAGTLEPGAAAAARELAGSRPGG